jgi:hypothetical protein
MASHQHHTQRTFPLEQFELLVRSYLDNLVEWEVVHNFAMAHFDDEYQPEFQRPIEDLHLMFFPDVRHDAESVYDKPQIQYLLALLDNLRQDVKQLGPEAVRQRELQKMANEDPSKHVNRAEYRARFRPRHG